MFDVKPSKYTKRHVLDPLTSTKRIQLLYFLYFVIDETKKE